MRTTYPTFKRIVHDMALFLGRNSPSMTLRCNLAVGNDANGQAFATGLKNLQDAVNQIEQYWPSYVEPQ